MALPDIQRFTELFHESPIESSLVSIAPLLLALGQLGNSYVNDVSPAIAVGFTVAMVVFAVVATGHHAAAHRLRTLESTRTQ